MALTFVKIKNGSGDYVDADADKLRNELSEALPGYQEGVDFNVFSSSNKIMVTFVDGISPTTINDTVLLHGSQAQVDARAAAKAQYEADLAILEPELQNMVDTITAGQAETIINNQFSDHTAGQRNILIIMNKILLLLAKRETGNGG